MASLEMKDRFDRLSGVFSKAISRVLNPGEPGDFGETKGDVQDLVNSQKGKAVELRFGGGKTIGRVLDDLSP